MNIRDIQNALIESADLVALAVCRRNAPKSDMMTRLELYRSYDNSWLDYHIKRKNIRGIKAGAAKKLCDTVQPARSRSAPESREYRRGRIEMRASEAGGVHD